MSNPNDTQPAAPDRTQCPDTDRTLTYRAVVIGVFGMVLMAMWVHVHEVVIPNWKVVAEHSPPASAVGVFLGVILIGTIVTLLRPRLRLSQGELVVVYAMLVTSAPLMSQGMWHRFLGLVIAIPENRSNAQLIDSFSDKLWPHGQHLIGDRRFVDGLGGGATALPTRDVQPVSAEASPIGATTALELRATGEAGTDDARTVLRLEVPRFAGEREQLVAGERYYFSALFRRQDMAGSSRVVVELVTDGGERLEVLSLRRDTEDTYSSPGGFARAVAPLVSLPRDIEQTAAIEITLEGDGRVAVTDVNFFSSESLARLRKGTSEVAASDLEHLPADKRDALLVRPDDLYSPAGIWYVMKGYVPWGEWRQPLLYWSSIVLAVFCCLLGISVILRRQWADNERFAFPLVVIPKLLIEQREEGGKLIRPLFRKNAFRIGVGLAFLYCVLQGVGYHIGGSDLHFKVNLAEYVETPAWKQFFSGGPLGTQNLEIWVLALAIAFFIDLDMLLSILIFMWICKIPYFFGEKYGWKNIKGPLDNFPFPHEQHIGAFLGLALVVLWVSRRHLLGVWRRILGRPDGVDDSGEAMSYRAAAALIVCSFVFFGLWGQSAGIGATSALIFFGFIVVCGLSAARIRTECGAPATYFTPYFPYLIFFLLGGLTVFGTKTMVLVYCVGGFMAVAQFLMFAPTQVEMMHLGNQVKASPKGVSWGLVIGILGGVLLGGYVMLVWCYGTGGDNVEYLQRWGLHQDWYFRSLRQAVARTDSEFSAAREAASATGAAATVAAAAAAESKQEIGPLVGVGTGLGVTLGLTALRAYFVGFWLHPVGYVLANTYCLQMCWGSLLFAWIIKYLSLKVGGPRLIRETLTPMFAGVFCGCVIGMLFWDIIAIISYANGVRNVFTCMP
jgi:hypothetical protein